MLESRRRSERWQRGEAGGSKGGILWTGGPRSEEGVCHGAIRQCGKAMSTNGKDIKFIWRHNAECAAMIKGAMRGPNSTTFRRLRLFFYGTNGRDLQPTKRTNMVRNSSLSATDQGVCSQALWPSVQTDLGMERGPGRMYSRITSPAYNVKRRRWWEETGQIQHQQSEDKHCIPVLPAKDRTCPHGPVPGTELWMGER